MAGLEARPWCMSLAAKANSGKTMFTRPVRDPNHELGDGYTPAFCGDHSPESASAESHRPHLAVEFVREQMRWLNPGKAGVDDGRDGTYGSLVPSALPCQSLN